MTLPMLTCPALAAPSIRHAFFTRQGGVSSGLYAALNCGPGSSDQPDAVRENRRLAIAALGLQPDRLASLHQVHGDQVIRLEAPLPGPERPRADGLVTRVPGIALGILAADCVPVLLADAGAGVIGACHAGWKGALAGITDATVAAMRDMGAAGPRIVAAIGPAIGKASYEVGPEFPARFLDADPENRRFFAGPQDNGHFRFDLTGYVAARLRRAGLTEVYDIARDTLTEPEAFFSYRRSTLNREPDYGRQLSAIALAG